MKKILAIIGGIIALGGVSFGVYSYVLKPKPVENNEAANTNAQNVAEIMKNTPPVEVAATPESEKVVPPLSKPVVEERPVVAESVNDTHVKTTATVFTEFYGSFDSATVERSIAPLSQMTTRDFFATLQKNAQTLRGEKPYTIQTRSLGAKILGGNKVEVLTRRVKVVAGVTENFQQKIVVTLQKVGDAYLVSDATWNPTTF